MGGGEGERKGGGERREVGHGSGSHSLRTSPVSLSDISPAPWGSQVCQSETLFLPGEDRGSAEGVREERTGGGGGGGDGGGGVGEGGCECGRRDVARGGRLEGWRRGGRVIKEV